MADTDEILFGRKGGLAILTINRPQALNALTLDNYRRIDPALRDWAADPSVNAVVVRGAGDRAFCAGGDVRAVYEAGRGISGDPDLPAVFFREEYDLIRRIHHFPKPYIAVIDGITMGGGAGISVNGAYRVATERTLLAMPETGIGLFPDVGATRFLNRRPGNIGRYLGLTGARVNAADALYCGFATHAVKHDSVEALLEDLSDGFHRLCAEISSWPRVLTHRDFHSRNLMSYRGQLYWIDFQDARMGPPHYDLASLLRDSYVDLDEDFVAERAEEFRQRAVPGEARDTFQRRFELMSIQRNLKALGTFGYQGTVKQSRVYLPYIPRTLANARRNLARYPEFSGLRRALARHLEELQ